MARRADFTGQPSTQSQHHQSHNRSDQRAYGGRDNHHSRDNTNNQRNTQHQNGQQQQQQQQPQQFDQSNVSSSSGTQLSDAAGDVLADCGNSNVVLFIRNLPKDITGKQLMFSLFADDGDHILSVNIHKHSVTGQSLGTAECIMDSIDIAQRLVYRYHNAVWDNQTLKLSILTDESVQHDKSTDSTIPIIPPTKPSKPVYSSIITQPVSSKLTQKLNKPPLVNTPIPISTNTQSTTKPSTTATLPTRQLSAPVQPINKPRLIISKNGKTITTQQPTSRPSTGNDKQSRKIITKAQKHEILKNTINLPSGKKLVKRSRSDDMLSANIHNKRHSKSNK